MPRIQPKEKKKKNSQNVRTKSNPNVKLMKLEGAFELHFIKNLRPQGRWNKGGGERRQRDS